MIAVGGSAELHETLRYVQPHLGEFQGLERMNRCARVPSLGSESSDRTDPRIESRDLRSGRKSLISAQFFCCFDFRILQSSVTACNVPRTLELVIKDSFCLRSAPPAMHGA